MLSLLDKICHLYERGILNDDDMETFNYEILRVYQHEEVQDYIDQFEKEQEELGTKMFSHLKKYATDHKKKRKINSSGSVN